MLQKATERLPATDRRPRHEGTVTGKAIRIAGLAFGYDGRRSLALAGVCATGNAEKCENDCRSDYDLFHGCPILLLKKIQDKGDIQSSLVQKRHTFQRIWHPPTRAYGSRCPEIRYMACK
jgi:hypothetical protein